MAKDFDINIRIKLTDEVTKNLAKVNGSFRDMGLKMRQVGREMSYVGMSITAVGASIVAPLALAYKNAGKFNAEIAHQLRETQNVFDNLSVSIGKSLLPVMRQLTDSTANLVAWWDNLDKATKDRIVQNVWNLGKALVALGVSMVIVGKSISTLANLSLLITNLMEMNPLVLAATVGILAVAFACWKWTDALAPVINLLDLMNNDLRIGIDRLLIFWNALRFNFKDVKKDWQDMAKAQNDMVDILSGKKQGNTVQWIKEVKEQLEGFKGTWDEIIAKITGGKGADVKDSPGSFWEGFKSAIQEAQDNMLKLQDLGFKVANDLKTNLGNAFGSFIDDAFSGQLRRAQDYFAEFGRSLLKMFSQTISEMIAQWVMFGTVIGGNNGQGNAGKWMGLASSIAGLFGGGGTANIAGMGKVNVAPANYYLGAGAYHSGGLIRAHGGLAMDEVPIIAQSGERVLSRSQNREYEKDNNRQQPIIVFKVWDYADIARHEAQIVAMVGRAVGRNGALRGTLKNYV